MSIPYTWRAEAPPAVILRTFEDGESVILHLDTERYFGLNAVGTRMWTLLTTSPSIQSAYAALLDEFDVEQETLRNDLDRLIERLDELKLIALHRDSRGDMQGSETRT